MIQAYSDRWVFAVFLFFACAVITALSTTGCSENKTNPTLPGAHPGAWMDDESTDFHGQFVYQRGTESCTRCHNIDSPGGAVEISCIDCHGPGESNCLRCHGGDDNTSGAPPAGLRGETSDTTLAVGAHTAHMSASSIAAALTCYNCHVVPVYLLSPEHLDRQESGGQPLDSIAEVVWHGIADPGNAVWDRLSRTCTNTYCHGNFSGGNTSNSPVWTDAGPAVCGSCHDVGSNPDDLSGKHKKHIDDETLDCLECHSTIVNSVLDIIDKTRHVNSVKDVSIFRGGLFQGGSCSGLDETTCHEPESWD